MAKINTVSIVRSLAQPIAEKFEVSVWDVVYEKEGTSWFLRIYLDRKGEKITVEDCEKVSRELSDKLDEVDPISGSYYLEVSSAGLGRKLKKKEHLKEFVGSEVSLKLIRARDGQREFSGVLTESDGNLFVLKTDDESLEFNLTDCSYVKLDDDKDLF